MALGNPGIGLSLDFCVSFKGAGEMCLGSGKGVAVGTFEYLLCQAEKQNQ